MLTVKGDLLKADCDFIVQQCNCLTIKGLGLSKSIAEHFGIDVYGNRKKQTNNLATEDTRSVPGTFEIFDNKPAIVCIYGQWKPGKVGKYSVYPEYEPERETFKQRLDWFRTGLLDFGKTVKNYATVGFPYGIGCGLAGGNWKDYENIIKEFAGIFPNIKVIVYKL